ncbi:hypothetical protein DH86_00004066, partial [Scytalidium sp. 3C]
YGAKADVTYRRSVESIKQICRETVSPPPTHKYYAVPHSVNKNFTGRADILERLRQCLVDDQYIPSNTQQRFVLYGLGGSGKTQTCLKFIEDHKNSFSGVFWIDASSVETIERGFEDLVNVCSQQGGENFTRTWLPTNKDWILVMDNADDPGVDLSKFFPQGKHGTIIITSRSADCRKYATSESWWWRVDQMEHEDAITLLLRAALESQDDPDKRALAKPIVECLGNFALAIVQASALIRQGHCTLTGFCDAFRDQKAQLFEYGDIREDLEYQHSVFTTWEI